MQSVHCPQVFSSVLPRAYLVACPPAGGTAVLCIILTMAGNGNVRLRHLRTALIALYLLTCL